MPRTAISLRAVALVWYERAVASRQVASSRRGSVTVNQARKNLAALDVVRAAAAVLVVLGHSRQLLFKAASLPQQGTGVERLLLMPTSLAMEAVAVFFVISGYLVGGQVLRLNAEHRFSWRDFLARRGTRLLVVLLPGLALTAVVDRLTDVVAPGFLQSFIPEESFTTSTLLCNAAFLQESRCGTYGSNSSLWSLSYELWFYLVFAAIVQALWIRGVSVVRRVIGIAIAGAVLVLFGLHLLWLIPAWLLGAATAAFGDRLRGSRRPAVWGFGLVGLVGLALSQSGYSHALTYPVIGLGTVSLLLTASTSTRELPRPLRPIARAGGWSYSLYVYHLPVVTLGAAILGPELAASPHLGPLWVYGVATVSAALAWGLSLLTERQTEKVRSLVATWGRATTSLHRIVGRQFS